jgi:signal peptidase I
MSLSSSLPLLRRVLGIALSAVALILAAAVLVPALLGFQRYVITSGSMTGTYDRGSLVFDRVVPTASLRAGDVITFRPPGHPAFVTHRIASVRTVNGQRVFTTKGDANRAADAWGEIALGDARQARVAFHLPYLGYGIATLSERKVRMVVIGVPALLIALAALAGLWRDSTPESRSTQPA